MAKKKKLQLQIIDPTGNVAVTHHFYFDAGVGNKLHLDVNGHKYVLKHTGELEWAIPEDDNG